MRRIIIFVVAVSALAGSFVFGGFRERLKDSLDKESTYPWDLHHKISIAKLDCTQLRVASNTSPFLIEFLDNKKIIVIATYNQATHSVVASIIDVNHRYATDQWSLECPEIPM